MTIQFVGYNYDTRLGSASTSNSVSLTALIDGISGSVDPGDLVIAIFATSSTANRTLSITDGTTDYTLIGSELYSNDTHDTNLRVAYKFMGATPDATTRFGPTGDAADAGLNAVYVFRGVDSTTPLDVAVTTATGTNTVKANPPSITPVTAGAFVVTIAAGAHDNGQKTFGTSYSFAHARTGGWDDTNDVTLLFGHIDDWTSGAVDVAEFTFSGTDTTSYSWAALSIALRPALGAAEIEADGGSYLFTGQDTNLERGLIIISAAGSYLFSGQDVVLSAEPTLNAVPGAYLFSGADINFLASGRVVASAGSYVFTGQDVLFDVGGVMVADAGAYLFTGQAAALESGLIFAANAGSYSFSGSAVQFSSGVPTSSDIQDIYRRNFSKMPFWRAVRAKELLWPKWKF